MERLNKYLSQCGISSRRKADQLILEGRVSINGSRVKELGIKVDPEHDQVAVDSRPVSKSAEMRYVVCYKPRGYVSTHAEFENEKSIFSILPAEYRKLKIIGRLDKESEGMLILTNDGNLVQSLTHPKFQHPKEYLVTADRTLSPAEMAQLQRGVRLSEGLAKLDSFEPAGAMEYRIVIHQGWKRQLRRMFEKIGRRSVRIQRVRIGQCVLGTLKEGECRTVTKNEIL